MNMRLKRSCRCSRTRGLTLIEVVAAIAILGTLLVGVVLAKSRHTRQAALAQTKMQAVLLTDELIAGWWDSIEGVPIGDEGGFTETDALRWETRLVNNSPIASLGARVVRVEVHEDERDLRNREEKDEPVLIVDLVVPDPLVEAREAKEQKQRKLEQQQQSEEQGAGDA